MGGEVNFRKFSSSESKENVLS